MSSGPPRRSGHPPPLGAPLRPSSPGAPRQVWIADKMNELIGDSAPVEKVVREALDEISVIFGKEILKIVPRRVSTEVDARLSYDTDATIEKGRKLIRLYNDAGISNDRVLIKIASTWEGIKAAEVLEKE